MGTLFCRGTLSSVTARAESGYDPTHSNYWIDVPVTDLFDGAGASIKDITVVKTEHNMFSFDYNTEVERGDTDESKVKIPCISIALNKSALKNAEALRLLYSVKNGAPDMSKPNKIKVEVNVNYKKTTDANAVAASDKLTFNLTAPANPNLAEDNKTDFATAISKLGAKLPWDETMTYQAKIEEQVGVNTDRNLAWVWRETGEDWWKNRDDLKWVSGLNDISDKTEAIKLIYETEAQIHLKDITKAFLGADCGIDIDNAALETVENSLKLPTAQANGEIKIKATFTNGVEETPGGGTGEGGNETGGTGGGGSSTDSIEPMNGEGEGGSGTPTQPETPPTTDPVTPTDEPKDVIFTITLSRFAARVKDVKEALGSYNPTVTATTTTSDIKAEVESKLTAMDLTNIRLEVSMTNGSEEGKVNVTIKIYDLLGAYNEVTKEATIAAAPAPTPGA